MVQTRQTFEETALADPDRHWELHDGLLREKPGMTFAHNHLAFNLGYLLREQLDREDYEIRVDAGRVRISAECYYIPDVFVVPIALTGPLRDRSDALEVYSSPLPLVVEIWSPSTGSYDIDEKLAGYQRRGDLEIWRIHPYERTLTAWRCQPAGTYAETVFQGGRVEPEQLPGVSIDLDALYT